MSSKGTYGFGDHLVGIEKAQTSSAGDQIQLSLRDEENFGE